MCSNTSDILILLIILSIFFIYLFIIIVSINLYNSILKAFFSFSFQFQNVIIKISWKIISSKNIKSVFKRINTNCWHNQTKRDKTPSFERTKSYYKIQKMKYIHTQNFTRLIILLLGKCVCVSFPSSNVWFIYVYHLRKYTSWCMFQIYFIIFLLRRRISHEYSTVYV